ncbi:SIA4B sialyltransferase, partial [Amia calva]|nr:SIA4B sialyltransferase [Amia calva]
MQKDRAVFPRLVEADTQAPTSKTGATCGCATCVTDPGWSGWFNQRFDSQQQLYLRDGRIPPDILQWWLALQFTKDEVDMDDIIRKLFKVISTPLSSNGLQPPHWTQCRRCAVVGNSANLQASQYGQLIDSHDFVIRMNTAETRGYERDVGGKTTHHFMYPESAVDLKAGVHLVLLPFKPLDLQWLASALSTGNIKRTYMRVKDRIWADKDKVFVLNPAFFKYVHINWTQYHGRYPSTGMLAIIFALHTCDQVSVFGYGADPNGNWNHYWEYNRFAGAFRKTGVHNADFETALIKRLDEEGIIKLHSSRAGMQHTNRTTSEKANPAKVFLG